MVCNSFVTAAAEKCFNHKHLAPGLKQWCNLLLHFGYYVLPVFCDTWLLAAGDYKVHYSPSQYKFFSPLCSECSRIHLRPFSFLLWEMSDPAEAHYRCTGCHSFLLSWHMTCSNHFVFCRHTIATHKGLNRYNFFFQICWFSFTTISPFFKQYNHIKPAEVQDKLLQSPFFFSLSIKWTSCKADVVCN